MPKILIVDDEQNLRSMLAIFFEKRGYSTDLASTGDEALDLLTRNSYDIIISDVRMPGVDGIELLQHVQKAPESPPVLLITAYGSEDQSLSAIRMGAADYIKKPFDMEELYFRVTKALDKVDLQRKVYDLEEVLTSRYTYANIIGKSSSIQRIVSLVKQIAHLNTTILITGESGTGKEVIARAIHFSGSRKGAPFVGVNCGALPETLLESELFGHAKGAFTGADRDKSGLFHEASHGTIFLDEISEMSPTMQVKLLRVLQDKRIRPVGSTKEIEVDVRIIAATNKDLSREVEEKRFRDDLYYRINVIHLSIPPLRKRKEDIPILVQHFIQKFCKELDMPTKNITAEAMRILEQYPWPGNVRELENILERIVALVTERTIQPSSLPDHLRAKSIPDTFDFEIPEDGLDFKDLIDSITKNIMRKALQTAEGNQTEAARLLKMTPRSFRYLVGKYDIR
ncbi:MAG TPA: sigma-54 dependent transcriptional regulator [Thermoanaerobaculia bacterium]|nr:sigma-54 dependent transcriptional regulator [Thermoanaerobaculia bacterium]HUM30544.1 sigma-54 dependent transcriptional regulator [Thermoanaerobaculia bacterium]HXK68736.1 sigma-54 dependent transcriptional regulator [Thermoanaerobaculia bacterium]